MRFFLKEPPASFLYSDTNYLAWMDSLHLIRVRSLELIFETWGNRKNAFIWLESRGLCLIRISYAKLSLFFRSPANKSFQYKKPVTVFPYQD